MLSNPPCLRCKRTGDIEMFYVLFGLKSMFSVKSNG